MSPAPVTVPGIFRSSTDKLNAVFRNGMDQTEEIHLPFMFWHPWHMPVAGLQVLAL